MEKATLAECSRTALTVGSFLATVSTFVVAVLDLVAGSAAFARDVELAGVCGAAFVTTLVRYRLDDLGS